MRPDLGTLWSLLLVWAVFMLLIPKRSWRDIPTRLQGLSRASRHHLYGPPARRSPAPWPGRLRDLTYMSAEAMRLLEVGLPLFVVALAFERAGDMRRAKRKENWAVSPSALLALRLDGAINGDELRSRLAGQGLPPIDRRMPVDPPRQYTMPPMAWRLEWEQRAAANGSGPGGDGLEDAERSPTKLAIQALGPLHIWYEGRDLAPALLVRKVLALTWLYMLARDVLGPKFKITRDNVADEGAPGLDPEAQRKVLRDRLNRLRTEEELEPLGARLTSEGPYLYLDLSDCSFDVADVLALSQEVAEAEPMLPEPLVRRIDSVLQSHTGEFLPEWEELEREVTGERGLAGDVIRQARRTIEETRVHLLVALAESFVARREPARAVRYLEQALENSPDSEIARKLFDACAASGQGGYAAQVRQRYRLDEGVRPPDRPVG